MCGHNSPSLVQFLEYTMYFELFKYLSNVKKPKYRKINPHHNLFCSRKYLLSFEKEYLYVLVLTQNKPTNP